MIAPRQRISGRRSLALWGLALFSFGHAALYIRLGPQVQLPEGLKALDRIVSLDILSWGWVLAGLPMLWCAVTRRPGWAAAAGVFLMTGVWGTAYLAGVVQLIARDESIRSGLLAVIYLSIQLLMLSGVPSVERERRQTRPPLGPDLPRTVAILDSKDDTDGHSA